MLHPIQAELPAKKTSSNSRVLTPDSTLPYYGYENKITVKRLRLTTGVALEYAETGNSHGTPVIFLHGFTDSWKSYKSVATTLSSDVRALFISLRGHGESDKPATGYAPKNFTADILAFMDQLNIPSAVIVGHSMGATIAQRFAIDHSKRVNGVVLAGSFATFRDNKSVIEMSEYLNSLKAAPDTAFIRIFQQSTIVKFVAPSYIDTIIAESSKLPGHVWKNVAKQMLSADLEPELSRIQVPTLVLWSNRDSFCQKQDQDKLLAAIPHAVFREYNGTGHAIHWEESAKFVNDLNEFLRGLQGLQGISPE